MTAAEIREELAGLADHQTALFAQRFFKTGPGEYGEGDLFRGIRVPVLRRIFRKYQNITLSEATQLLKSPFHEDRLLALFLFVSLYTQYRRMPRVMLRYAIERYPEADRQRFLKGEV
jgi:hypothetical protein